MHNLNTARGRADFLREISNDVTPNVNYDFKDRFIKGIRDGDYIAAWKAAYEAGIREGDLIEARKKFGGDFI